MSHYSDREAACLWYELKYIYPELAPPEDPERSAELDEIELFGPEDLKDKEAESCPLED